MLGNSLSLHTENDQGQLLIVPSTAKCQLSLTCSCCAQVKAAVKPS